MRKGKAGPPAMKGKKKGKGKGKGISEAEAEAQFERDLIRAMEASRITAGLVGPLDDHQGSDDAANMNQQID